MRFWWAWDTELCKISFPFIEWLSYTTMLLQLRCQIQLNPEFVQCNLKKHTCQDVLWLTSYSKDQQLSRLQYQYTVQYCVYGAQRVFFFEDFLFGEARNASHPIIMIVTLRFYFLQLLYRLRLYIWQAKPREGLKSRFGAGMSYLGAAQVIFIGKAILSMLVPPWCLDLAKMGPPISSQNAWKQWTSN